MKLNSDWEPVTDIASKVNSQKLSAVELVNKSLSKISQYKEYNAIIAKLDKQAIKRAELIDRQVKSNHSAGRLAGVPFIAKDNFLVKGAETTAASNILKGFNAPYQSTAINLLEAEGAICVAKANMDAFAHGGSTENSDFGVTKNPYDKTRVSGGSSGGSAVSVALGMAPFSLGTDTGGSIRQPASFCGVVGYKPTYGLVSRSGVIAMASSLDCIGPLTTNVSDAIEVMKVIARVDQLDSTMVETSNEFKTVKSNLKDVKVATITNYLNDSVDQDVITSVNKVVDKLKKAGAIVDEISIPSVDLSLACYYIICPAEISSNLARYDGIKYGYSQDQATNLSDFYKLTRGQGFGKEAKRRIMIGTYVLSSGYYDAYYLKAQTVRTKLINDFNQVFKSYDYLIGPVTPSTAFKIGEKVNDPLKMYLSDIMTVASNLLGIPSISIPNGYDHNSLPIGLQIMSPQLSDHRLLSTALSFEELINESK